VGEGQDHFRAEFGAFGEEISPIVFTNILPVIMAVFGNVLVGDQIQQASGVKIRLGLNIIGGFNRLVGPMPFEVGGHRLAVKSFHGRRSQSGASGRKKTQSNEGNEKSPHMTPSNVFFSNDSNPGFLSLFFRLFEKIRPFLPSAFLMIPEISMKVADQFLWKRRLFALWTLPRPQGYQTVSRKPVSTM
jgi:hypothetical protein